MSYSDAVLLFLLPGNILLLYPAFPTKCNKLEKLNNEILNSFKLMSNVDILFNCTVFFSSSTILQFSVHVMYPLCHVCVFLTKSNAIGQTLVKVQM